MNEWMDGWIYWSIVFKCKQKFSIGNMASRAKEECLKILKTQMLIKNKAILCIGQRGNPPSSIIPF